MSYHLKPNEPIDQEVKRIASEQVNKSIAELTDTDLDKHEKVHQFRKRCKKIRGLLRLVRPALGDTYQVENRWFRDKASEFSEIRDAEVLLETSQSLRKHAHNEVPSTYFHQIDALLRERQSVVMDEHEGRLATTLIKLSDELRSARERIEDWVLEETSFSAIQGGFKKTYQRGCHMLQDVLEVGSDEVWHEWRKRTKYHGYHLRLLRNLWKPVINARRDEIDELGELLGDDHDLAVFEQTLHKYHKQFSNTKIIEKITCLCQKRRSQLQQRAIPLGTLIYAEKPKHICRRLKIYWEVVSKPET
ncbi:CHAD domain-containing protein [uncultured Rubinisphaera sp.]|uniref:CHAD domain-containing protein n=1 Tax=uncultured Rubinisphaera sp. TaxID=1678686 RepID=UPI0030D71E55